MNDRKHIRLEHEGAVSLLTIDRPDRLNALDREVLEEVRGALEETAGHGGTRCLVITGAGKAFIAGADIAAMKDMGSEAAREFSALGHRTFDLIEALPCPVIAAVNGFALGGGCELALACDFIYASEKAKLGQPEVKLGVIPGFGGTQRLARRVGVAMARELIYSGAMIDAAEALRIGLVNAVHPPEELMGAVRKLAATIASMGPVAVTAAKRVILEGEGVPLADANHREAEAFARCFETEDQKEGMAAFLDKRPPAFEGR
jgi:enoyl-CoA hydratase